MQTWALYVSGAVCNGVYPTDAPNQVEYLINDSETKFYFAEDEEQLDKVLQIREQVPTLEKVIVFDMEGLRNLDDDLCMSLEALCELGSQYRTEHPDAWSEEIQASDIDDLMILTYTSGTTGPPQGCNDHPTQHAIHDELRSRLFLNEFQ